MSEKTKENLAAIVVAIVLIVVVLICYGKITSSQKDDCRKSGGHPVEVHNGKGAWICSTDLP